MAVTKARVGRGTTLAHKRDGQGGYTTIAEEVRIASPEVDNGQVEATHLSSDDNAREFIPSGFTDYGMCECSWNYYSDEATDLLDLAADQETCSWKITIPDKKNGSGTDSTAVFEAYIQKLNLFGEAAVDGNTPMRSSMTLKITGKITWTESTSGV